LRKNVAVTVLVLSAVLAGCRTDDFLTSLRLRPQTQFVLRSVGGNPLPAVAFTIPGFTTTIFADTLTLRNDGSGERSAFQVSRGDRAAVEPPGTLLIPLRYTLNGTRIDVQFFCPVGYFCIGGAFDSHLLGEVTRDGIRFDRGLALQVVPLVYEQLR